MQTETTEWFVRIIDGQDKRSWCGYISSFLLFPTYQMYYCPSPTCDYKACMHACCLSRPKQSACMDAAMLYNTNKTAINQIMACCNSAIWLVNCLAINNYYDHVTWSHPWQKLWRYPEGNTHACNDIRIFNSKLFAIDNHPFPKRILFCLHTYFSLDIVNMLIHAMKDSG